MFVEWGFIDTVLKYKFFISINFAAVFKCWHRKNNKITKVMNETKIFKGIKDKQAWIPMLGMAVYLIS